MCLQCWHQEKSKNNGIMGPKKENWCSPFLVAQLLLSRVRLILSVMCLRVCRQPPTRHFNWSCFKPIAPLPPTHLPPPGNLRWSKWPSHNPLPSPRNFNWPKFRPSPPPPTPPHSNYSSIHNHFPNFNYPTPAFWISPSKCWEGDIIKISPFKCWEGDIM